MNGYSHGKLQLSDRQYSVLRFQRLHPPLPRPDLTCSIYFDLSCTCAGTWQTLDRIIKLDCISGKPWNIPVGALATSSPLQICHDRAITLEEAHLRRPSLTYCKDQTRYTLMVPRPTPFSHDNVMPTPTPQQDELL